MLESCRVRQFYSAICAPEPKIKYCLIRTSKQSLEKIVAERKWLSN